MTTLIEAADDAARGHQVMADLLARRPDPDVLAAVLGLLVGEGGHVLRGAAMALLDVGDYPSAQ